MNVISVRFVFPAMVLAAGMAVATPSSGVRDFNNDGQDDLAMYDPITRTWYLQETDGTAIGAPIVWGAEGALPLAGDFDGDGFADLAVYHPATGTWDIRAVDGTILAEDLAWGAANAIPLTGDFNGDGACDLAYYIPQTGAWHIRTLGGTVLANGVSLGITGAVPVPGDYNGDGKFDLAVYTASNGNWYIRTLGGVNIVWGQSFGFDGTVPITGDFDGNGIYDMAVYAPYTAKWYIRRVNGSVLAWDISLGSAQAVPLAGKYDGGNLYQLASFGPKPSNAWTMRSATGTFSVGSLQVTAAPKGAVPVGPLYAPGDINYAQYKPLNDFNGNGASDLAVYHPDTGNWFIRTLHGSVLAMFRSWGYPGTLPVPADYTGDGITDLAVYDPSNGKWFIVTMNHQHVAVGFSWGFPGAVPVPGDYDGDGVADLGVYDLNTGNWYVWSLAKQQVIHWAQPWGWKGDVRTWERPPTSTVIPVPYDFDQDGKVDLAVYYRGVSMETSLWYILGTSGASWVPAAHWGSSGSIPAPGRYRSLLNAATYPAGITTYKVKYSPPNDGTDGTFNTPFMGDTIKLGVYGRTLPVSAMDFDGTGFDDHATYDYTTGEWKIMLNDGSGAVTAPVVTSWGFPGAIPADVHSSILKASGYGLKPW